jgi:hypothetical protein
MFTALHTLGAQAAQEVLALDQTGQTGAAAPAYLCNPENITSAFNNIDQNDDGLVTASEILSPGLRSFDERLVPFLDGALPLLRFGFAGERTGMISGVPLEDASALCSFSYHRLFTRGDCDGDGQVSGIVTDAVVILTFNFVGGDDPPCLAACDADGDGSVTGTVTDAVYLLSFNFLGRPPPPAPYPGCSVGNESDFLLGCETPPESCGA